MRHVKLVYDCAYCGKTGIAVQEFDTTLPDSELITRVAHDAVCTNPNCPEKGVKQEAMEPAIVASAAAV
jgi:hypothetical protein